MDPKLEPVLSSAKEIATVTGGSLEFLGAEGSKLSIRYIPGRDDECPECVLTAPQMKQLVLESLKVHAPEFTDVVVVS